MAGSGPDLLDALLRLHGGENLGRAYLFVRLARYNVAGHIDYSETSRILSSIHGRAGWASAWLEAADRHRSLAQVAEERGAGISAGDAYLRASLCAHWASMFSAEPTKTKAHRYSVELYRRGSPYFRPPSEVLEVHFQGDRLPGYLRKPAHPRPPVVIMIGGADTNKEELHHWGTEFTLRGLCALPFDGPGQGELSARYDRLPMRLDRFHEAVSAMLDHLERMHPELDLDRIGLFGNSLGGYLALDAAGRDPRIRAVICNGGFADARSLDNWPPSVLAAFSSCLGFEDPKDVAAHIKDHLDLSAVPRINRPPSLVVHGGREDLSTEEEAATAAKLSGGTLLVVEDAWHTCTNRDHLISPVFGDWMVAALRGNLPPDPPRLIRATDERDYEKLFLGAAYPAE